MGFGAKSAPASTAPRTTLSAPDARRRLARHHEPVDDVPRTVPTCRARVPDASSGHGWSEQRDEELLRRGPLAFHGVVAGAQCPQQRDAADRGERDARLPVEVGDLF